MRVLLLEPQQKAHRPKIRPQIEQTRRGNLAKHHAPAHLSFLEGRQQLSELSYFDPDDVVYQFHQSRIGLAFECDHNDPGGSHLPGLPCEKQRQAAIARNQTDRVTHGHGGFGHFQTPLNHQEGRLMAILAC